MSPCWLPLLSQRRNKTPKTPRSWNTRVTISAWMDTVLRKCWIVSKNGFVFTHFRYIIWDNLYTLFIYLLIYLQPCLRREYYFTLNRICFFWMLIMSKRIQAFLLDVAIRKFLRNINMLSFIHGSLMHKHKSQHLHSLHFVIVSRQLCNSFLLLNIVI